jgi:hypothetical protein
MQPNYRTLLVIWIAPLVLLMSGQQAHAELVLSPEDPSAVLGLVAAAAAGAPYLIVRGRAYLKQRRLKRKAADTAL